MTDSSIVDGILDGPPKLSDDHRKAVLSRSRYNRIIARMRVPKMVKNGIYSGLPVSPVLEKDKIPKEIKNRHEAQSRP